jgi:hypothetical protein
MNDCRAGQDEELLSGGHVAVGEQHDAVQNGRRKDLNVNT